MGDMADDAYDRLFDDLEFEEQGVTCQRCGEGGLHWEETDRGWRLYNEDGDRHTCESPEEGFNAL